MLKQKPEGLHGILLTMFLDPKYPGKKHGVVVFALPPEVGTEEFSKDLYGPLGYSSQIDRNGFHLYGRDTWGTVNENQLEANPDLFSLSRLLPKHVFVLAGVRTPFGKFVWPLNDSAKFILVKNI